MKTTHFTNFGVQIQPRVADQSGFVHYREGFETLPSSGWTAGERWIHSQERRIERWREG